MKIEERIMDSIVILRLVGDVASSECGTLLKSKVRSLASHGYRNVVLDLERVGLVDSTGLGEIVCAQITLTRRGGIVKLLHLTTRMQDLLIMTKLVKVFETFDSEADAVRSFSAPTA